MNEQRYKEISKRAHALSKAIVDGDVQALRAAIPDRASDHEWAHVIAMGCMIAAAAAIKGTGGTMRSAIDLLRGVWGIVKIDFVDRIHAS